MAFSGKARRARLARLPPARCPLIQGYLPRSLRIRSRCFERRHEQTDKRIGAHHKASHRYDTLGPISHAPARGNRDPTNAGWADRSESTPGWHRRLAILRIWPDFLGRRHDAATTSGLTPTQCQSPAQSRVVHSKRLFFQMWGCQRSERTREYCYFGT
jgi:hypothetical protein